MSLTSVKLRPLAWLTRQFTETLRVESTHSVVVQREPLSVTVARTPCGYSPSIASSAVSSPMRNMVVEVVAEVDRLLMMASGRLQLAAEGFGTIGLAIRRWHTETGVFGQPTPATKRWRIRALPHLCQRRGSAVPDGGSNCFDAARVRTPCSKGRLAMLRVVSFYHPNWVRWPAQAARGHLEPKRSFSRSACSDRR